MLTGERVFAGEYPFIWSGIVTDGLIHDAEKPTDAKQRELSNAITVAADQGAGPVGVKSLFDDVDSTSGTLEVVRLDGNETAIIPFTHVIAEVDLHYVDTSELTGYVRCNGDGCVLCSIGRKTDKRLLLPVFVPTPPSIAVLPIPPAMTTGALKPQLLPLLTRAPSVLLISKPDRAKYAVQAVPLSEGMNDGAAQIKEFKDRWGRGEVDLRKVYQQLDNQTLAQVSFVKNMMSIKGIK